LHPIIFKLGPLTVYSFGAMMALAFLTANYFASTEARRRGWNQKHISRITFIALVGGIVGSKLFSLLEDFSDFLEHPIQQLFSPSGLTFYGGFIVATVGIYWYLKKQKLSFRAFADALAPVVFLAYGIGRIGCHLAGDGDYGIPTKSVLGLHYSNGTAKPTHVFEPYFDRHPEERAEWKYDSLRAINVRQDDLGIKVTAFDEVATAHPTPLYEFAAALLAFLWLWSKKEKWQLQEGKLFGATVMLMGIERFLVEFLRINPLYLELSQAQWISIGLIIIGAAMFMRYKSRSVPAK
jgi:phosphatidylglycerol---prolipoprotein diacylglyceryl transferase